MKFSKILLILLLSFLLSGCFIKIKDSKKDNTGGGFYRSTDGGLLWQQKVLIPTTEQIKKSIAGVNVVDMFLDPQDPMAIYLGTAQHGLYYTYDAGNNWHSVREFNAGKVSAVAVDPTNKCILYISSGNKVFRSADCSRTWEQIYFDSKLDEEIVSVVLDPTNTSILYIGLKRGDLFKSLDAGKTWAHLKSFDNKILKILFGDLSAGIIYVATVDAGIFKSVDGGISWFDINQAISAFPDALRIVDVLSDPTSLSLYIVSQNSILKSENNDTEFRSISTLQSKGKSRIYGFAINPVNDQELYYATETTFFKSTDGGNNWSSKKLPSGQSKTIIRINPKETNVLYLGVYKTEQ